MNIKIRNPKHEIRNVLKANAANKFEILMIK